MDTGGFWSEVTEKTLIESSPIFQDQLGTAPVGDL